MKLGIFLKNTLDLMHNLAITAGNDGGRKNNEAVSTPNDHRVEAAGWMSGTAGIRTDKVQQGGYIAN